MHTNLVDKDHAVALCVGVLFPSRRDMLIHSESACVSVCEAANLEVLHMDSSGGSRCRLV